MKQISQNSVSNIITLLTKSTHPSATFEVVNAIINELETLQDVPGVEEVK